MLNPKSRQALVLALLPVVAYMAMRFVIVTAFPIHNFAQWVALDFIKNLPRLLSFGLAFWFAQKIWPIKQWSIFHSRGWSLALAVAVAQLATAAVAGFWNPPVPIPNILMLLIALGSLLVAVFEEFQFRFLLLDVLTASLGNTRALLISAALFMVYHIQAQPLVYWPYLFCVGLAYGLLRKLGVSLYYLIAIHATYDTLYFYLVGEASGMGFWAYNALQFLIAGTLLVLYQAKKANAPADPLIS